MQNLAVLATLRVFANYYKFRQMFQYLRYCVRALVVAIQKFNFQIIIT